MISVQVLEPKLASRGTRMDRDAGLRLGTATREDRPLDRDTGSILQILEDTGCAGLRLGTAMLSGPSVAYIIPSAWRNYLGRGLIELLAGGLSGTPNLYAPGGAGGLSGTPNLPVPVIWSSSQDLSFHSWRGESPGWDDLV